MQALCRNLIKPHSPEGCCLGPVVTLSDPGVGGTRHSDRGPFETRSASCLYVEQSTLQHDSKYLCHRCRIRLNHQSEYCHGMRVHVSHGTEGAFGKVKMSDQGHANIMNLHFPKSRCISRITWVLPPLCNSYVDNIYNLIIYSPKYDP